MYKINETNTFTLAITSIDKATRISVQLNQVKGNESFSNIKIHRKGDKNYECSCKNERGRKISRTV